MTEIPLYRSPYQYRKHKLVEYLIGKGYWQPSITDSPRWILLYQWNQMWKDGQTSFQSRCFQHKDFWIDWSEHHPDQAAELWPRVLDLLRADKSDDAAQLLFATEHPEWND